MVFTHVRKGAVYFLSPNSPVASLFCLGIRQKREATDRPFESFASKELVKSKIAKKITKVNIAVFRYLFLKHEFF